MTSVEEFARGFGEEPGYLDYGRVGPVSQAVRTEASAQYEILGRARYGTVDRLQLEDARVRDAVSALTGFPADRIAFQPNASLGLMHAAFGLTGGEVLLSRGEFPSVTYAAVRAAQAMRVITPTWLETDHGRVTPAQIREQITPATSAVMVSLVDSRTGYLTDIDGIRQVIGDRLLIVDAIQGFGVVDAPYEVADVVLSGGQKWARAGWGTGFLALSERAIDHLTPVFSGWTGTAEGLTWDEVVEPAHAAKAFSISNPDSIAQARFAASLEEIAATGVPAINDAIADGVERVIDLADEFALPVTSPRNPAERAGIVVVEPPETLTALSASLFNHGVSASVRQASVRFSVHAGTTEETLGMLRAALTSYASAI
ncbi:aminotransferase class V-fold PLP-dependent enzyme [Leifsonia aquatica]|uniref:Aminotransferase, class V n=2 Tax=Leifsonia aquatica TaxID=144185 RepID=U2SZU8_LEIAQ|nr:aminotransferase class V-fold PLP-dependent enzyme [Leifsonia aquatica]ERK70783.1 aminotransferase, class V [Leifsonia aquatica ATCC 14665]MBB2966981.1 selenocysteine lyase/cysteine desulfurase [Leifsonia aquatica]